MVAVGVVPFAASCAVTYAKFGIPVGLPMADQVWAAVNAHRRYFLAANGGKAFSFKFLPSTLTAYLQPFGIRFSGLFPYVIPPGAPASWLGGAVMDQTYPTASLTATSPLLLLLSIWGTVTAFRPKALGQIRYARIILLCRSRGYRRCAPVGVHLAAVYRRPDALRDHRGRGRRASSICCAGCRAGRGGPGAGRTGRPAVLAIYCIVANMAISLWPVSDWTLGQAPQFVSAENALSVTPLAPTVRHGAHLPYWAPSGQLFIANHCSGLYLSTGDTLKDVPGQQIQHLTWLPVEQEADITHTIGYTFNHPASHLTGPVTILTYGSAKLVMRAGSEGVPVLPGHRELGHLHPAGRRPSRGGIPISYLAHPPEADRDH